MNADDRIQWLHKRILDGRFPNAGHLSERFGISHRQAQRDVEHLRGEMGAPIAYNAKQRGFYYSAPYTLPTYTVSANAEDYIETVTGADAHGARQEIFQMQIPYSATLSIPDKLTRLELKRFIVEEEAKSVYRCEFHSIEMFLGVLFSLETDVTVLSPKWLRERLRVAAKRLLRNHGEEDE